MDFETLLASAHDLARELALSNFFRTAILVEDFDELVHILEQLQVAYQAEQKS